MTNKTITFRTQATITASDTITNDEYFDTLLKLWDESDAATRRDMLWDSFADSTPEFASDISQDYRIVLKDGTVVHPSEVMKMTAKQLVSKGVFY